jgi:predicted ATPase
MLTDGLTQFRTTAKWQLYFPFFLSFLADALLQQGQVEKGLATATEALHLSATNLDRFWEAELYRLKGELTLQQSRAGLEQVPEKSQASRKQVQNKSQRSRKKSNPDPRFLIPDPRAEAEACFLKAIEIAQQQGAKSLELRATMSLARLWQQQGKRTEAHKLLSEIYNWFTEGFDTKDLREAKGLLEELRQ